MNRHFDSIDILFLFLIFTYFFVLISIVITMIVQKKNLALANKGALEITSSNSKIKEYKIFNNLKKSFTNIIWSIRNIKYPKLSFKNIRLFKKEVVSPSVLSLNELIEDDKLVIKKEPKVVDKKKNCSKTKRNVPKKKKKSKKKKNKRR